MQHTTKYELNLIESGDAFSAKPLNDNAEKLEAALSAEAAARQAADETQKAETNLALEKQQSATATALFGLTAAIADQTSELNSALSEQTSTLLDAFGSLRDIQIVIGHYVGNNQYGQDHPTSIDFSAYGRLPKILFVTSPWMTHHLFLTPAVKEVAAHDSSNYTAGITWTDTAVSWYASTYIRQLNTSNDIYYWVAIF